MYFTKLSIKDFTYYLQPEKIAQFPLEKRDESKLLVYKNSEITDSYFKYINDFIPENSYLVLNDTKVILARLHFKKETGAKIEIFCLEPAGMDYQIEFQKKGNSVWRCYVGNVGKWKKGKLKKEFQFENKIYTLYAEIKELLGDSFIIEFNWEPPEITFSDVLDAIGLVPLPPYIKREAEKNDESKYQTIYAEHEGSVAAPTAGLHFTNEVLEKLKLNKIDLLKLTLSVGAGTFKPVKEDYIINHKMHTESVFVSKELIEYIMNNTNKELIAVGTTSLRTLESLYWFGLELFHSDDYPDNHLMVHQWQPYENKFPVITLQESLSAIIKFMNEKNMNYLTGETCIIIIPGYEFKVVNGLITNFHLPSSTLLLLIAAFIGKDWRKIYDYALENNYRFLSYGDSSLLFK
jgi:S-adenosylmethionine:tRNA ribosyltransferase-isomerase